MLKFNCIVPRVFLKMNGVKYGKKLKLIGWPFIFKFPKAKISIGSGVKINSNFWSNLLGIYQRSIIVAKRGATIEIGDNVGMSGVTIYALEKIQIGNDCLIGANVKIIDNDFHPVEPEARLSCDNSKIGHKPVYIGKNVFIGMNSIILKGTKIGDNCVIGAGSVLHGEFPDNCIIAGNPAKIIRVIDNEVSLDRC